MTVPSVLLIEDDDWFAEQQERILASAGFRVIRVSHGLAAIDAMDSATPSVIVLDIFLPGPNAMSLLHELQSHTDLACIPVIICSNNAPDVPVDMLVPYGVRAVIDKALMQPGDLVAAVRREAL